MHYAAENGNAEVLAFFNEILNKSTTEQKTSTQPKTDDELGEWEMVDASTTEQKTSTQPKTEVKDAKSQEACYQKKDGCVTL